MMEKSMVLRVSPDIWESERHRNNLSKVLAHALTREFPSIIITDEPNVVDCNCEQEEVHVDVCITGNIDLDTAVVIVPPVQCVACRDGFFVHSEDGRFYLCAEHGEPVSRGLEGDGLHIRKVE
jgi:hypothetical protein